MADSKNAWQHVLHSDIGADGSPVRIDMNCTFEESFLKFTQWVNEVFKNPGFLPIKAIVEGGAASAEKVSVRCTFQGSYAQFTEWMTETFQHPEAFTVKVCVGTKSEPIPKAEELSPFDDKNGFPAPILEYVMNKRMTANEANAVMALVKDKNKKIEAIKLFRAHTGLGLKEAKDIIELVQR